jgi:L-lactate utilization protein LutC
MNDWNKLADKATVEEIIENLKPRQINAFFVESGKDAKEKVLELIPAGSRVLASSSQTLMTIGLAEEIDNSGKYVSVRKEYMSFDHKTEADKIRISRSTPDFIVGSIHAITKQGEAVIASNTGSQIAAYSASAGKVIWVVGIQKIVENLDAAFKRIDEYILPLESERLKKLYGVPSNVSQILLFNKSVNPSRVTIIFVNESLGF